MDVSETSIKERLNQVFSRTISQLNLNEKFDRFWALLNVYPQLTIAFSIFLCVIVLIFVASMVFPDPFLVFKTIIDGKELPYIFGIPSLMHPLGTNDFGNDTLIVLIHATRNSILLGFIVAVICVCIAVFMGVLGSFKGGVLDEFFQLITNIALVFPVIPTILLLSSMLNERSMFIVATIIALVSWPWAARSIRAQVLTLKEREYVKLAKVTGMPDMKIAIMEIVPNVFSYIMLVFAIIVGIAITFEAAISMIGLGQETDITLGRMLYWSKEFGHVTGGFYHLWLPPGIVLTLFIILIYVLHSSMTQIFNPRLRER